jgi:hypothetical protein
MALRLRCDRLAEAERPPGDGVLVDVGVDGVDGGLLDEVRRREVGVARFIAPWRNASRVISRMTDSVKTEVRAATWTRAGIAAILRRRRTTRALGT